MFRFAALKLMIIIVINTKKDDLCTNSTHHSIHLGECQQFFGGKVSSLIDLPKVDGKVLASHFLSKITKGLIVFIKRSK